MITQAKYINKQQNVILKKWYLILTKFICVL